MNPAADETRVKMSFGFGGDERGGPPLALRIHRPQSAKAGAFERAEGRESELLAEALVMRSESSRERSRHLFCRRPGAQRPSELPLE